MVEPWIQLAACLDFQPGSHSAIIPMISIQSHWNPLENSGLTSDKQNQQEPKEGVGLLSRGTEVKFSNFQKAD